MRSSILFIAVASILSVAGAPVDNILDTRSPTTTEQHVKKVGAHTGKKSGEKKTGEKKTGEKSGSKHHHDARAEAVSFSPNYFLLHSSLLFSFDSSLVFDQ